MQQAGAQQGEVGFVLSVPLSVAILGSVRTVQYHSHGLKSSETAMQETWRVSTLQNTWLREDGTVAGHHVVGTSWSVGCVNTAKTTN